MKLRCRKSTIYNMCLWAFIGIANLFLWGSLLFGKGIDLLYRVLGSVCFLGVLLFCVMMVRNLYTMYKQFIVVDENDIMTIHLGLFRRKKELPLSDLELIEYNRYNMVFYIKNQKKVTIDLYYIKPEDGNAFVSWLHDKGVEVKVTKKGKKSND